MQNLLITAILTVVFVVVVADFVAVAARRVASELL